MPSNVLLPLLPVPLRPLCMYAYRRATVTRLSAGCAFERPKVKQKK